MEGYLKAPNKPGGSWVLVTDSESTTIRRSPMWRRGSVGHSTRLVEHGQHWSDPLVLAECSGVEKEELDFAYVEFQVSANGKVTSISRLS